MLQLALPAFPRPKRILPPLILNRLCLARCERQHLQLHLIVVIGAGMALRTADGMISASAPRGRVSDWGLTFLGSGVPIAVAHCLVVGGGGLYFAFAEKMVLLGSSESSAGVPEEMVYVRNIVKSGKSRWEKTDLLNPEYRAPQNEQRERIDDGGRDIGSLRRGFHGSRLPKLQRQESARQDANMGQAKRNTDLEYLAAQLERSELIDHFHARIDTCKGKRQLGVLGADCGWILARLQSHSLIIRQNQEYKTRQEQLVVRLGPGAGAGCLWQWSFELIVAATRVANLVRSIFWSDLVLAL
ncbi:hypothetical protein C8F04DRAFT_1185702 [Mycena alexandri]|uniref:Uncharacterized protein n=1 Tax=Mycena alexandri TaxID=1745969 RepID=A0AAD6SSL2_9AGAR|nr:hypothetical protein C8F04DRAFT_1185702 [Mycena alexandri]